MFPDRPDGCSRRLAEWLTSGLGRRHPLQRGARQGGHQPPPDAMSSLGAIFGASDVAGAVRALLVAHPTLLQARLGMRACIIMCIYIYIYIYIYMREREYICIYTYMYIIYV